MRAPYSWLAVSALAAVLAACGAGAGGGGGGGGGDGSGGDGTPVVLPGGSTMVVQSTIAVGDFSACNGVGGVHIDWGIDDDKNGSLDPSEIDGSGDICNGSNAARQILLAAPERDFDPESGNPGDMFFVSSSGAGTWDRVAGKTGPGQYFTANDGSLYPYDAYLLTNASGAPRTADFGASTPFPGVTLTAYSGGFNPATPLVNVVDWSGSYDGDEAYAVLALTLNPGETRVVIVSFSFGTLEEMPLPIFGYLLVVTPSTPHAAAAAMAGVEGSVGGGKLHMHRVAGLRPGGVYDATVHATGYAHGDQLEARWFCDRFLPCSDSGAMDPATGDAVAAGLSANGYGTLWVGAYGASVPSSGAYTLKLTPGSEERDLLLGVPFAGSVSHGAYSYYYIENGTGMLEDETLYTVTLTGVSDPGVWAQLSDSTEALGPCEDDDEAATLTCTITTEVEGSDYLYLEVWGEDTAAGATYTLLASGPSKSGDLSIDAAASDDLTGQFVNATVPAVYTVSGVVEHGSYRVHLSGIADPAVTAAVTDNGVPAGTGSCGAVVDGQMLCAFTSGGDADQLTVAVNGAATAGGSRFDILVERPVLQEVSPFAWGSSSGSVAGSETSYYDRDAWPNSTYTLTFSNVTHPAVTVYWETLMYEGECGPPVSGTFTCTLTTGDSDYPDYIYVEVYGGDTVNGAWYDMLLE